MRVRNKRSLRVRLAPLHRGNFTEGQPRLLIWIESILMIYLNKLFRGGATTLNDSDLIGRSRYCISREAIKEATSKTDNSLVT